MEERHPYSGNSLDGVYVLNAAFHGQRKVIYKKPIFRFGAVGCQNQNQAQAGAANPAADSLPPPDSKPFRAQKGARRLLA